MVWRQGGQFRSSAKKGTWVCLLLDVCNAAHVLNQLGDDRGAGLIDLITRCLSYGCRLLQLQIMVWLACGDVPVHHKIPCLVEQGMQHQPAHDTTAEALSSASDAPADGCECQPAIQQQAMLYHMRKLRHTAAKLKERCKGGLGSSEAEDSEQCCIFMAAIRLART